jgi:hypothetical protein
MTSKDKIQHMLITHLLKEGDIDLNLPNNMRLSVGITRENKNGYPVIQDQYCWIAASKDDRETFIDSYGLEMKFSEGFVVQDEMTTEEGNHINFVDVI